MVLGVPASHMGAASEFSFLLTHIVEGADIGSGSWVPATHMGDHIEFLVHGFSLDTLTVVDTGEMNSG